ncbi:MAG: phospholipid carrier-dependent glycosyltransferase [Actinomycetota bacterium]
MTADAHTIQPSSNAFRRAGDALARLSITYGGILVPLSITAAAGFIRFWRLGHPHSIIPLDETYYAPNAFGFACHGTDMAFKANAPHTCDGLEPVFVVHPPVGKLMIALGLKIFGYRPFGWRFSSALVGALCVLLVYLIGRRLWEKRWPAAAAAILLGVEGLHFVQSRIAMLDIFVCFFILLGVWLMLEDRARAPTWTGLRWWRLGSGVAFGLALASKWSALFLLPVVAAVMLAWEVVRIAPVSWRPFARRKRRAEDLDNGGVFAGQPADIAEAIGDVPKRPRRDRVWFQVLAIAGTFVIVPLATYMASYTSWFLSSKKYVPPRCNNVVVHDGVSKAVPKTGLALWICDQKEIADYHRNLKSTDADGNPIHPYMSKAWSWPWISRPASHYYMRYCAPSGQAQPCKAGQELRDEEVLGLPNPLIWWTGFFVALPACLFWIVKRDEVAGLLVILLAPLVLPWFVTTRPLFMFYMTPASPFIVLMVVHALQKWRLRWTAVWFVALAIALFGYFYPVLAAYPIPSTGTFGWTSRIWFGHGRMFNKVLGDCTTKGVKILCWI